MNLWRVALAAALLLAAWGILTPELPGAIPSRYDKLQHVVVFAVLAVLAALAFPTTPRWRLAGALAAGGVLLELAQGLTGRTPDALDAAADALGSALALVFPRKSQ